MARDLTDAHRAALEAPEGEDQPLLFVRITHASLATPVLVVNDTGMEDGAPVAWRYGGEDYVAFPFSAELLTDGDEPPRGRLEIANVDQSIGEALRDLTSAADLQMTAILPSEFDTSVNPRLPLATPAPIWSATSLRLRDVEVDAMAVRGTVVSLDDTREPYPATRATQALLPGLFR